MSKEVLHFSYDINYVVSMAAKIFIEKKLYDNNSHTIKIGNKIFLRKDIKQQYWEEIKDEEAFAKKCIDILKEEYPNGTTLDEKDCEMLSEKMLLLISEKVAETIFQNDDTNEGVVECKPLNKKIRCRFGGHYDAVIDLVCEFFGTKNLYNYVYPRQEIINFIRENITIESDYTSVQKICRDIETFGIPEMDLKTRLCKERGEL